MKKFLLAAVVLFTIFIYGEKFYSRYTEWETISTTQEIVSWDPSEMTFKKMGKIIAIQNQPYKVTRTITCPVTDIRFGWSPFKWEAYSNGQWVFTWRFNKLPIVNPLFKDGLFWQQSPPPHE